MKNLKFYILLVIVSGLLFSCSKKRNAPFCYSCEKGIYFDVYNNPNISYSIYVRDNGDTLAVVGSFSDSFRKAEGVKVCARLQKYDGLMRAIYIHTVYRMKCASLVKD